MNTMKALVKYEHGPGSMEIRDVPVPEPGRGEALIKVAYCGICGTDLKILDGQFAADVPVIVGHEFSGVIARAGEDVTGWKTGDRVVGEQHTRSCGLCRYCLTGRRHLCPKKRAPGYGVDGAFAEYIRMPASLLHEIPPSVSLAEAALTEPMAVAAYGILSRTGIRPEDFVVILGCGSIAILALQIIRAEGAAEVVMTGIDQDEILHFAIARRWGADETVNVMKCDPVTTVMDKTKHEGADVVIDLSGSPQAILQGLDMLRKDGRFCAIGLTHGDVAVPWQNAVKKALHIDFCYSSDYESWMRCLSLIQRKKVCLEDFTRDIYPLEKWEDAFRLAQSGHSIKVLIHPT